MKFKKIVINNFMRYKGENEIKFSCDPEKNVTVVMGDNTFGKTTLAQAFRWGLYGEIVDTRYGKSKDIILLNKDVLGNMGSVDKEKASVELEVQDGNVSYVFIRESIFSRKFPLLAVKEISQKLWMKRKVDDGEWGAWVDDDSNKKDERGSVTESIKLMFPYELSNYFFFDGEKWSDEKKTNMEIKNSISSLMGITPLVKMKEHLQNGNKQSVIKSMESRLTGSNGKFDDLKYQLSCKEELINKWTDEKKEAESNVKDFADKIQISENKLESNTKIEQYQEEFKRKEQAVSNQNKILDSNYNDLIREFSKNSYKYFAAPLLERVVKLLKNVNLEGKDIPDITVDTIDYLIGHGECLCGNKIGEKEKEWLENLKKAIPPNVIGSYVGQYQNKIEEWKLDTNDFLEKIKEKAEVIEGTKAQIETDEERIEELKKIIDGKINFGNERRMMNANKVHKQNELEKIRKCEMNIKETNDKINYIKMELSKETAHTKENLRIQRMIKYARALYTTTSDILKKREEPLMEQLNEIIKENFAEMFQEKEKYAQMGNDYKLHLYYNKIGDKNINEPVEELTLSEGEIIARNFVFIVSILELAQKKKIEDSSDNQESDVLNLPLVLDGPFSKLGDINTKLIAKVLPEAAEQVIIFMLEKDWDASDLETYTLPEYKYFVNKENDENSASILNSRKSGGM